MAIVYSYRTVVEKDNRFLVALPSVFLVLVYMCLVSENCYGYFKSVAKTLRYRPFPGVCIKFEIHIFAPPPATFLIHICSLKEIHYNEVIRAAGENF